jgi:hypothetical protein
MKQHFFRVWAAPDLPPRLLIFEAGAGRGSPAVSFLFVSVSSGVSRSGSFPRALYAAATIKYIRVGFVMGYHGFVSSF